uniref:Folate receptor-like domain-containing protein n=1 Tax=Ciona savignyi TaxID=51511 RepID=H2Y7U9_CIOSA
MMLLYNVVLILSVIGASTSFTTPTCPRGDYHKETPSAETHLQACKQYTCDSCCFENITIELASVPIAQVGKLDYHQCSKQLTDACSNQHTYLQCLYQCSPNLYPWMGKVTRIPNSIPLCSNFCDQWYLTCQADMTCAPGVGNWKTGLNKGFDADGNPVNPCKDGVMCRNYTEVYGSGQALCENIWGTMFTYTTDTTNCIDPSDPAHNAKFVESLNSTFTSSVCAPVEYVDAGMIVGIVFGVLAALGLIAAGVVFYMRQKKSKG